jgi:anti-sigma B factor antagonist
MARKGLEQIIMHKQHDVAVVSLLNKRLLDAANIQAVWEELLAIVNEQQVNKIVINLDGVEHLSSTVLGKMISLLKMLKRQHGDLGVCCIHPNVQEIFEVTQLDKVIGIYKTVKEAVQGVNRRTRARAASRGWLPW